MRIAQRSLSIVLGGSVFLIILSFSAYDCLAAAPVSEDAKRQNRGYEIISSENSQKLSFGEDVLFSLSQNTGWDFACTDDPTSTFTDDSRVIPSLCKYADKAPSAKNFIWDVNGRSFILLQNRNYRSPSFMVLEIDNTGFVHNYGQFNPGEYFRYYISNESVSFQNEYNDSERVVIWLGSPQDKPAMKKLRD